MCAEAPGEPATEGGGEEATPPLVPQERLYPQLGRLAPLSAIACLLLGVCSCCMCVCARVYACVCARARVCVISRPLT